MKRLVIEFIDVGLVECFLLGGVLYLHYVGETLESIWIMIFIMFYELLRGRNKDGI